MRIRSAVAVAQLISMHRDDLMATDALGCGRDEIRPSQVCGSLTLRSTGTAALGAAAAPARRNPPCNSEPSNRNPPLLGNSLFPSTESDHFQRLRVNTIPASDLKRKQNNKRFLVSRGDKLEPFCIYLCLFHFNVWFFFFFFLKNTQVFC